MKRGYVTLILALIILPVSLWGFGTKIAEFVMVFSGDEEGVFTLSPLLNYLLASLGFLCLLCWAVLHGMFNDVEKPKYAMLDNERLLDGPKYDQRAVADEPLFR